MVNHAASAVFFSLLNVGYCGHMGWVQLPPFVANAA